MNKFAWMIVWLMVGAFAGAGICLYGIPLVAAVQWNAWMVATAVLGALAFLLGVLLVAAKWSSPPVHQA